jgi:drug/metabolite transporter (DMT)-like permease
LRRVADDRALPLSLTATGAGSWATATVPTKVALHELAPLDLLGAELSSTSARSQGRVCSPAAAARPCQRNWLVFAVLGVLAPGLSFGLVDFGLSRTGAADGAFLIASQSLFGVVLARILLGERVSPVTRPAVALAFAGSAFVGLAEKGHGTSLLGDLLVFAALAAAAVNGVSVRRVSAEAGNVAATVVELVSAALFVAPVVRISARRRSCLLGSARP